MTETKNLPYEFFTAYHATYLHFTSKSYNYFDFFGRTKYGIDKFDKRKDKYVFYKVARGFQEEGPDNFAYYVAWVFMVKPKVYPRNVLDHLREYQDTWARWHDDRLVNFEREIDLVIATPDTSIYDLWQQQKIHTGTVLVMDVMTDLLKRWNETRVGSFPWDEIYRKTVLFKNFYEKFEPVSTIWYKKLLEKKREEKSFNYTLKL